VRAARRKADLAVVYYHWGIERSRTPNGRQHALAAAALNAGATVVLGAHPHVLQPVSAIPGRRLVAWSLGNFVFPAHSAGTADTGILLVHLNDRGVAGHILRRARITGVQPRLLSSRP
jgi:poly-gamma-glutamate capsule biosynthesis protein CapA/YwtB (metallophosphatase superfamily)